MDVNSDTPWSGVNFMTLFHAYSGLMLFVISLIFIVKIFNRRKVVDMYPWIYKNYDGIKTDIKTLTRLQLPKPNPAGLAATIEGLGLLALLLALLTGGLWYITTSNGSASPLLLEIHTTSVGLIEVYFYGHGLFGLLHLVQWCRAQ